MTQQYDISRASLTAPKVEPANSINKRVNDYILNLTASNFFGKVELTFENGKVIHITQTKSIKP